MSSEKQFCVDDAMVACPLFQGEYGGSKPTSALQLRIVRIDSKIAAELNRRWHSRLPEIPNFKMCEAFAAEFGNLYYAVALWSTPSNQNMFLAGCYELRRFAISPDAPKNTASRMLSVMKKMIHQRMPHIKRLISYQDTEVHSGTIYKASGWKCAGKTHKGSACGWDNNVRFRFESNGKKPLHSIKHRWELDL
jgi:hypothetical protein